MTHPWILYIVSVQRRGFLLRIEYRPTFPRDDSFGLICVPRHPKASRVDDRKVAPRLYGTRVFTNKNEGHPGSLCYQRTVRNLPKANRTWRYRKRAAQTLHGATEHHLRLYYCLVRDAKSQDAAYWVQAGVAIVFGVCTMVFAHLNHKLQ